MKQSMEIPSYITGFVDGEGSFLVSFSERKKMNMQLEVRPAFTVSQHKRSKNVLLLLQEFFRCGSIRFNKRDETWKYEVRSLDDLILKIIPHFELFPLQTAKAHDFEHFKQVCWMMRKRHHLRQDGISTIVNLAFKMNNLGARRYTKDILLRIVGKMKV